jgi:hypothetical protein
VPNTLIRRAIYKKAVRQKDASWAVYELKWPRYEYEIISTPVGRWRYRVKQWPAGGVFASKKARPIDYYDPVKKGKSILIDLQRTSEEPESLLRFVNKWGSLGVGIRGDETCLYDGVEVTQAWLSWIKKWIEAFYTRKQGKGEATWESLADFLNANLSEISPMARPVSNSLIPAFRVSRLLDAIFLELWDIATRGSKLRRCPACKALFFPERANQRYCHKRCAVRVAVRRSRQRAKKATECLISS